MFDPIEAQETCTLIYDGPFFFMGDTWDAPALTGLPPGAYTVLAHMEVTNGVDPAYVMSPFATAMVGGDGKKKEKHGDISITTITSKDKSIKIEGKFSVVPKWQVKLGSFLASAAPKTKPGIFGQLDLTRKPVSAKVMVNPAAQTFTAEFTKDIELGAYDVFVQVAVSEIGNDLNLDKLLTFREITVK